MLELHAGKLARAVLRGRGGSNASLLPDPLRCYKCVTPSISDPRYTEVVSVRTMTYTLEESQMLRFTAALLMIASAPMAHGAAPVPKPDPAADLKALEGTWEVVTYEVKGKKASDAGYASLKEIIISAGRTNLLEREETDLPIKIDPSKTPKAIDVYLIDAMKLNSPEMP